MWHVWAHPANAQETALFVGIPHCREGIKFAGCPAFLTQVSKRHNNKVRVLLRNLPLCHQGKFLLLHKSLVARLVHMTSTGTVNPEEGDVDSVVKTTSHDILQVSKDIAAVDLSALTVEAQLYLPLDSVGVAYPSRECTTSKVESRASPVVHTRSET
jgi:hypothetical protein